MKRVVIFNYNSKFARDIQQIVLTYNPSHAANDFAMDMYPYRDIEVESEAGPADVIIHSGGKGRPVKEDIYGVPKIYICHSHEWKAAYSGGKVATLSGCIKGIHEIDVLDDDEIFGRKGKMRIKKFHELAVVKPPKHAKVLAVSRAFDVNNDEIEIIEALKYPDGSVSVQGHPEEGTAAHIFHNLFNKAFSRSTTQPVPTTQPAPMTQPTPTMHPVPTVQPDPAMQPAPMMQPASAVQPTQTVQPA
jgi:GMP synthase-like glutamine amidotransferase